MSGGSAPLGGSLTNLLRKTTTKPIGAIGSTLSTTRSGLRTLAMMTLRDKRRLNKSISRTL